MGLRAEAAAKLRSRLLEVGPQQFLEETLASDEHTLGILSMAFGLDPDLANQVGEEAFTRILVRLIIKAYHKRQKASPVQYHRRRRCPAPQEQQHYGHHRSRNIHLIRASLTSAPRTQVSTPNSWRKALASRKTFSISENSTSILGRSTSLPATSYRTGRGTRLLTASFVCCKTKASCKRTTHRTLTIWRKWRGSRNID